MTFDDVDDDDVESDGDDDEDDEDADVESDGDNEGEDDDGEEEVSKPLSMTRAWKKASSRPSEEDPSTANNAETTPLSTSCTFNVDARAICLIPLRPNLTLR